MAKIAFLLPTTAMVHVHYKKNGVNYKATMPTPKSNNDLQVAMLKRQVAMSQINRLEGFEPVRTH